MLGGKCYRQQKWERRISGIGSGSWPTPTVDAARERKTRYAQGGRSLSYVVKLWPTPRANERQQQNSLDAGMALSRAVRMWPTPTVHGNYNCKGMNARSGDGLATAGKMYSTPVARDWKGKGRPGQLGTEIVGQLNPTWVEWLMGFPIEWTALQPLETAKFQRWLQQFGILSEKEHNHE